MKGYTESRRTANAANAIAREKRSKIMGENYWRFVNIQESYKPALKKHHVAVEEMSDNEDAKFEI